MARRKAPKPGILNPDRRRHLVSTVVGILRHGQPTVFAYEGACRHGLRVRLVLDGWGWHTADAAALDVVAASLRQLGAKRPTWYQGQPAYTEEGFAPILRRHCIHCGRKLDRLEQDNGLALRFCSNNCRTFHQRNSEQRTLDDYHDAQRAAGELKRLKRLTTCPNCGVEFVPKKWAPDPGKPRYCSNRCSKQHYFVKLRDVRQVGTFMCEAAE